MIAVLLLLVLLSTPAAAQHRDVTMPNPHYTPGASRLMSLHALCTTSWGTDRRFVTAAMKRRVFANYRLTGNDDDSQGCKLDASGRRYEVDHLIPRCAAGADEISNLWANCYSGRWNAVMKDRLEIHVCKEICDGKITLQAAHDLFMTDWQDAYRQYFGEPQQEHPQ